MSNYEFSADESSRIASWAKQMRIFGILNIILGITVCYVAVDFILASDYGFIAWVAGVARLMNAIASAALGVVLLRPIDNLKRVVNTTGSDIKEMLTALSELLGGFNLVYMLSIFYIVVLVVEFTIILAS